jgi:manganese transport protein
MRRTDALAEIGPLAESSSGSARTVAAAREALAGRRRGVRALLPFAGPAFIASVAYMDPGNFATNIQGGAGFGYRLLWVVLFANACAMLFQSLSAKLGIATGRSLAELCRDHLPRPAVWAMWVVSEVAAMATDLAEFLGATIGLNLLLGVPLLPATLLTGAATYAMLLLERRGFRPIEALITGFVGVMAVCYVIEVALAPPGWGTVARGIFVPWLGSGDALLLAVGIVGATVMPHAIYLHSSLTQRRIVPRSAQEAARILRFSNIEVCVALGLAGLVNMAMMISAGAVFHDGTHNDVASIETAYHTLVPLLGAGAAWVFLLSLLSSGLSSSVVGTMAGQVIMQGFVGFRIPLWLRRLATMLPSVAVIAAGVSPTRALVLSQVVLSIALPVPLVALLAFTARRDIMGPLVNRRVTTWAAWIAGAVILGLNLVLLLQVLGVTLPV